MESFQLIHIAITDLCFSNYFYLDLSDLDLSRGDLPKLPQESDWVQVDLPINASLPEPFAAFKKRLVFIQKRPEMYVESDVVLIIEDIFEISSLLSKQQAYHYELDLEYFADLESFQMRAYLDEIQGKLNEGSSAAFGIQENGIWIGFSVVEKDDNAAYLLELMVEEKARGKGYGRILLMAAESWVTKQQLTRLWTSVTAQNNSAFAFYKKLGFTPFKERYAHKNTSVVPHGKNHYNEPVVFPPL